MRYGSIGGLEYEVPQSRLYCLCINVALCSTALQGICRVIRRSSMTMKAHTYYIIFGRPPIGGGKLPPPYPLAAPLSATTTLCQPSTTTTFAKRAYRCSAPAVWDSLPKTVVNSDTVTVFKSRPKTFLFSRAFSLPSVFSVAHCLAPAPLKL